MPVELSTGFFVVFLYYYIQNMEYFTARGQGVSESDLCCRYRLYENMVVTCTKVCYNTMRKRAKGVGNAGADKKVGG